MKNEKRRFRLIKEEEKRRQVTHWDLDYLPKEEMVNIASFLNDVLEAEEQGKSPWSRWYDRMGAFFEKKFGPKWQDDEKDFWEKFPFY